MWHTRSVSKRPFLVLNGIGALWLAFGVISVQFYWPGQWAEPFPFIGTWFGMVIAVIWIVVANAVLGLVLIVRWSLRPPHGPSWLTPNDHAIRTARQAHRVDRHGCWTRRDINSSPCAGSDRRFEPSCSRFLLGEGSSESR